MSAAFEWYEERVSALGSDFPLNIDAALHALIRNPQQLPIIHKILRRALVRRFPYQVFFVPEEHRVVVLAVFHSRRNPRGWRKRTG